MPPFAICRQRELHAVERGPVSGAVVVAEQDLQVHRLRELGGAAEAPEAPVELGEEGAGRAVQQLGSRGLGLGHGGRRRGLEVVAYGLGALQYLFAAVLVGVGDAQEELLEGGHAARGMGGK